MMSDTAQPMAAETVDAQLDSAADAFKAFTTEQPVRPRDEQGRFASQQVEAEPEEDEEIEAAEPEGDAGEDSDEYAEDAEAADEAQPEAIPMPSSWSKDDAEVWNELPPEAQAKIAEREGQRDQAVNAKFQEAANIRKANEALIQEAATNRDQYAQAINTVLTLVQPGQRPDPRQYGAGTGAYDRESYDLAVAQWEESSQITSILLQQQQELAAQQEQEAEAYKAQRHAAIEQEAWPKFVAEVPDLQDPVKGRQIVEEIINYARSEGVPEDVFAPDSLKFLTSVELRMAWKAMQYDLEQEAKVRVQAKKPAPKPAAPSVKPGTVATRQSINASRMKGARERLARENSIDAGADVFKQLFSKVR